MVSLSKALLNVRLLGLATFCLVFLQGIFIDISVNSDIKEYVCGILEEID